MSWNQFQKEYAGRGYSDTAKSKLYERAKSGVINPKASEEANVGKFQTFKKAIESFNLEYYPPLENPETPRQVRIRQWEVVENFKRERRKLRNEWFSTTDVEKKLSLRDEIEKLSRLIEKLKLEIETVPDIFPKGSWQQFEHEISGAFGILFSPAKLSELYKKTKDDVISGKYANFKTAVKNRFGAKQTSVSPPPPPLPPRVTSISTFVPKTIEQMRQEAKEEVASRMEQMRREAKEEVATRIQVQPPRDTYYDPESVQARLQQAMSKFKPENEALLEYRRELRNLISAKMDLVRQNRIDEVGKIDEQIKILNRKIASLS